MSNLEKQSVDPVNLQPFSGQILKMYVTLAISEPAKMNGPINEHISLLSSAKMKHHLGARLLFVVWPFIFLICTTAF